MKGLTWLVLLTSGLIINLAGCSNNGADSNAADNSGSGWETLLDGSSGMENFYLVGPDVWTVENVDGGVIQGNGTGDERAYLVSKDSYDDFELRVEFWVNDDTNSGVFIRCDNTPQITSRDCYEVNIFEQRPEPDFSTGAIVRVAKTTNPPPKTGGKWNTIVITARGDHMQVAVNGVQTADGRDGTHAGGAFALQWAVGLVRFRKAEIRRL